jgi:hypothetical protein
LDVQVDRISNFSNNAGGADLVNRLISLEKENEGLRKCKLYQKKTIELIYNTFITLLVFPN